MPYTENIIRKALLDSQISTMKEVETWDPTSATPETITDWEIKVESLSAMLKHRSQESEMRRRHVDVVANEIEIFERSARSINVLNPGAGREAAAHAAVLRNDLNQAKMDAAESESLEAEMLSALESAKEILLKARSLQEKG